MKHYQAIQHQQQQGLSLLATLIMVIIFTFVGMSIANKGKKNQEMTGATVRSNVVFEAAETSLRRATRFIKAIKNGEPRAGLDASLSQDTSIKKLVENFDKENAKKHSFQFVTDPAYTFIWQSGALKNKVCSNDTVCPKGLDFNALIDDNNLWNNAIESTFTEVKSSKGQQNYLAHVKTYTFIELLRDVSANTSGYEKDGNFIGQAGRGYYYLITVKGSGFPPGADQKDTRNSRENVILQAVYAQRY